MSQSSAFEYIRAGATPFFRLPVADVRAAAPYTGADAVILGVPYDLAATAQPGARFAPFSVRRTSAYVQTFHPEHKIDVFGTVRAIDGGNVAFPPFARELVRQCIENEVAQVLFAGAVPFLVGGDHSIALPAMRAVAKRHGPLAVVHVDAHLDTSDGGVWADDHHHGTPLRHAITEGLVEKGQLHQIGVRASWGYPEEGALAAGHGAALYGMRAIEEEGVTRIARRIVEAVGARPAYITFDIDGVDPAYAPGTGTPEPGGLTAREALHLMRSLRGLNVVGFDLVEVCPALDHADITSHLASRVLYEALALLAAARTD
jgi:agmatinase